MRREESTEMIRLDRRSGVAINVDLLAGQVREFASSLHLRVVPVTPVSTAGSCHLVLLGKDDLSAADFCELAASAGARLLYVQVEGFDAETDPNLSLSRQTHSPQEASASDPLAELHRDAMNFNGRIRQLELAFVVGCVLHCWAIAADWYDNLLDRAAALVPCHQDDT